MADQLYTQDQINAVWADPRFHALGLESRRAVMNAMDPRFRSLNYGEQNKVFEQTYRQFATSPTPIEARQNSISEDLRSALAQSGLPPIDLPPDVAKPNAAPPAHVTPTPVSEPRPRLVMPGSTGPIAGQTGTENAPGTFTPPPPAPAAPPPAPAPRPMLIMPGSTGPIPGQPSAAPPEPPEPVYNAPMGVYQTVTSPTARVPYPEEQKTAEGIKVPNVQIQTDELPGPPKPPIMLDTAPNPWESQPQIQTDELPARAQKVNITGLAPTPGGKEDPYQAAKDLRALLFSPADGGQLKADSTPERIINVLLRATAGLNTPESVAMWATGAGVARALPEAVNSIPGLAEALAKNPVLAKGVRMAAGAAVPTTFGVGLTAAAAPKIAKGIAQDNPDLYLEGMVDLGMGAAALGHAKGSMQETAKIFPEAREPGAVTAPTRSDIRATAADLQAQGENIAAEQWREHARQEAKWKEWLAASPQDRPKGMVWVDVLQLLSEGPNR
jgi:hypothetical protein